MNAGDAIDARTHQRHAKALTNFKATLPPETSIGG